MNAKEFSLLGAELELTAYGPYYCGVVYGWPVTVVNNHLNHLQFLVDRKRDRQTMKRLTELLKTRGGAVYSWLGNRLSLTGGSPKRRGSRAEYVGFCAWALTSLGLRPLDHCPCCGARYCDCAALTDKGYRLAHFRCLRLAAAEAGSRAEDGRHRGSYALGFLGAFLGMVIGTLPTFCTIAFLGMEFSLFFALIPICAYFGYKLLGGRMNMAAVVVTLIMSVLAIFLLYFEMILFSVMQMYEIGLGEGLLFLLEELGDAEVWLEIALSSTQELLFTALGVVVAWRIISVTDGGRAVSAKAALRMAVPCTANEAAPHEMPEPEIKSEAE